VKEYVGGYEDWLRQRPAPIPDIAREPRTGGRALSGSPDSNRARPDPAIPKKLTYREREELHALPGRIEALEAEQRDLEAAIAGPHFYKESADAIRQALARREAVHEELLQALARWDELESRPR